MTPTMFHSCSTKVFVWGDITLHLPTMVIWYPVSLWGVKRDRTKRNNYTYHNYHKYYWLLSLKRSTSRYLRYQWTSVHVRRDIRRQSSEGRLPSVRLPTEQDKISLLKIVFWFGKKLWLKKNGYEVPIKHQTLVSYLSVGDKGQTSREVIVTPITRFRFLCEVRF